MTSLPEDIMKEVVKAAEVINAAEKAGEKFLVPSLASKATRAAEQYPYDHSIVTASQVLNKMAEDTPFISRAELNSLYDKLYSSNTKLGDVFAEELDRGDVLKGPQFYNRDNESDKDAVNDFERVADPILSNALNAAFDGSGEYKPYSAEMARKAERVCNAGLLEVGYAPKKVSVFAGQEDIIICKATYETPKGQAHVLVPVEMQNGAALFPTMFLGQDSFVDLQGDLLKRHVVSTAGLSFHADGDGLLKVLSTAKNGVKKVASEVEMAAIRLNSETEDTTMHHDVNGVIGLKIAEPITEVEDPEYEKSPEHFEFANRVTSSDGAARFLFSDRVVEAGRDIIVRKMAQFGYPRVQVKVASCDDSGIDYAVGVGVNAAILTQVEVVGNNVMPPKIAIASGKVKAFSRDGVKELVEDTKPDTRVLAASSMSAGLKPSELVEQVREAVAEGNLIKAEDAINVLGEVDKNAQRVAIAVLLQGLSSDDEEGNANDLDALARASSNKMTELAGKKVRDVPVFNNYNVFFPEE